MKYAAPIVAALIGLVLLGPIGAILAVLIWWLVQQMPDRKPNKK